MVKKFLLPLLAGLLLLAGCSGSAVAQADVEDTVAGELEIVVGERPDVTCPGDLDAEVGAEMTCVGSLPGDGEEYEVYLVVEEVDGGEVFFEIEVAEQPLG